MADAAPKTQIKSSSEHENPSKFFLYKAALVTVFLVLVPLFPSLAPEFFNQTLHARSWELLQLIFVGIAVSYGLFSKKNDEPHKENNAQSYVSKLLQVSSVFDDDSESQTVIEENKFQALNSQYYRGEPPLVVVAKETPAIEEKDGVVSQISQKPLLLPVRSLKQRVPIEADSSSKRLSTSSRKSRNNGDLGRLNVGKVAEKEEENVVLRSPIPWRSRSGRMEVRENGDELTSFGVAPSMEEQELNRVESRSFRSSRPNGSPKNLSHSNSFEYQSKVGEDVVRKKSFAPPPPAPPPPPSPLLLRKSVLVKSSSSVGHNAGSTNKVLARSVRSVPTQEESSENEMDEVPMNPLRFGVEKQDLGKSVRTFKPNESMDYEMTKFFDKSMGPNPNPNHNPKEEDKKMKEFADKVLMDTTESESEAEAEAEAEAEDEDEDGGNDVGPDVDKKADEFIAKFREQIRLQRIETIRRSTAQRAAGKTNCR